MAFLASSALIPSSSKSTRPRCRRVLLLFQALSFEDPPLHAHGFVDRPRRAPREIDVGAPRVERRPSLELALGVGHLITPQPSRAHDADAAGAPAHARGDG